MVKATVRTVERTGEYQAHPRSTPLRLSAAPATATATARAISQGCAPTFVRALRVPGKEPGPGG